MIGFSVLFYCKPLIKLSPNKLNAVSAGGIAGFLAGVIGTGGAIRGLALAAFDLEKGVFVATSAAIDSGVDFSPDDCLFAGQLSVACFLLVDSRTAGSRLCRLVSGEDCAEQIGPEQLPANRPAVYLSHRANDTWEGSGATPDDRAEEPLASDRGYKRTPISVVPHLYR